MLKMYILIFCIAKGPNLPRDPAKLPFSTTTESNLYLMDLASIFTRVVSKEKGRGERGGREEPIWSPPHFIHLALMFVFKIQLPPY